MPRTPYAYLIYVIGGLWFVLMISQPILKYAQVDRRWLDLVSQIMGYAWLLIIVSGVISYGLLLTPKFRDRRKTVEKEVERVSLPPRVRTVSIGISVFVIILSISLIMFLVPDSRTQDLLTGLLPFAFIVVYMTWFLRRARRIPK